MKKRLRRKQAKKLSKIEAIINRKKIDAILSQLAPLTPHNLQYADGYFIFHSGNSSILYFDIQETPDWEYGIWLNGTGDGYQIFGEHRLLIDKFKPSRTYLSYQGVSLFKEHVLKIQQNPILYFGDASYSGMLLQPDAGDDFEGLEMDEIQLVAQTAYDEYLSTEQEEKQFNEDARAHAFRFFQEIANSPNVAEVAISDKNKLWGLSVSPRYDVFIKPVNGASAEEVNAIYDEFHRMEYEHDYPRKEGRFFLNEHQFRYQHLYRSFDADDKKSITHYFHPESGE